MKQALVKFRDDTQVRDITLYVGDLAREEGAPINLVRAYIALTYPFRGCYEIMFTESEVCELIAAYEMLVRSMLEGNTHAFGEFPSELAEQWENIGKYTDILMRLNESLINSTVLIAQ